MSVHNAGPRPPVVVHEVERLSLRERWRDFQEAVHTAFATPMPTRRLVARVEGVRAHRAANFNLEGSPFSGPVVERLEALMLDRARGPRTLRDRFHALFAPSHQLKTQLMAEMIMSLADSSANDDEAIEALIKIAYSCSLEPTGNPATRRIELTNKVGMKAKLARRLLSEFTDQAAQRASDHFRAALGNTYSEHFTVL